MKKTGVFAFRFSLLAVFLSIFSCFPLQGSTAIAAEPLNVLRVTPEGEDVSAARQIVIEFNREVVPVGRMDRTAEEVGISITPELACAWRWVNTATLSCELDRELGMKQATRYQMVIGQTIATADGQTLAEPYETTFTTSRPDVNYYNFSTWKGPATPVVRIVFDQAVTHESVEKSMVFKPASGKGIEQLVKAEAEPYEEGVADARRVWLIQPREPLPADQTMILYMKPGLVSAEGPEKGVEDRGVVTFDTYPDFAFAGLRCINNEGVEVLIKPDEPQTSDQLCNPMRPASLAFSVPVLRSEVKDNLLVKPDLAGGRKDFNPWGDENRDWSMLDNPHTKDRLYYTALPVGLKANQAYEIKVPAKKPGLKTALSQIMGKDVREGLQDEFGRTLMKPVTLKFSTDHRPPNFVLPYRAAVLEKATDSDVPLYVNNLESFQMDYRRINSLGVQDKEFYAQGLPQPEDVQFAVPLGVREMLGGRSGAIYGSLNTEPAVDAYNANSRRIFAQVTPFQLHVKLGHYQSTVWVVDLQTGLPVQDVNVSIYKDELSDMGVPENILGTAVTDSNGVAILPGSSEIDPENQLMHAWREEDPRLFVRLDKGEDMALMPLSNDFYIDTYRASNETIWSNSQTKYGHMVSWGLTAQGVYRAGDIIEYKIYIRDQDNHSLVLPSSALRYDVELMDATGKQVQKNEDVKLSAFGAFSGSYKIPKSGAVGWYDFKITVIDGEDTRSLSPLKVLVSDFTVAPFQVEASMNGDRFMAGDHVEIEGRAKMHAGGAFADAPVRITTMVKGRYFSSEDPLVSQFFFDTSREGVQTEEILQKQATLDDKGEWKETLTLPSSAIVYGQLITEVSVQDDRGKSIASQTQAEYFGVDRLVGMKSLDWSNPVGKNVALPFLVINAQSQPVAGVDVRMAIEKEIVSTARVKGAGNAYLSDITREWKQVGECKDVSNVEGSSCLYKPESAGNYRVTAYVLDSKGVEQATTQYFWVSGSDYVQWDTQGDTMLPIVPEKQKYQVGDIARFLIKNPYPGAQALVTVERYGVMDSFVVKLEGSTPTFEIPVKPDYMPGFYLSVVLVSPRVEAPPAEEGQVDMGKPAFRMGYVTIPVRDPVKQINIDAKVDVDVYQPRDQVKVTLKSHPVLAPEKPEPVEFTVVVLDEAVFDLIKDGKKAFDPYEGFYHLDNLDLRNYSLMMRLVGRQKFEKKGANPGGDGGTDIDMRTLFKYVAYWNPSLPANEVGEAEFSFEAPDNLTNWRVMVLAATPTDRMGLGEAAFKVNKPVELRPVMPNMVHEGDQFVAGFSVMNRTEQEKTLHISIMAEGDVENAEASWQQAQDITLAPYKRETVYMPINVALLKESVTEDAGKISFTVTAADENDSDGLKHEVPVLKTRIIDTVTDYGTSEEPEVKRPLSIPDKIYTDVGGVKVTLSPSVIANLEGAFRYMRDYPYTCWEQKISRAVMASEYEKLKEYLPESFVWEGSPQLADDILSEAGDYQAPNGGMTYFISRDEYVDPYLSAYTALAFRWLSDAGYKIPQNVESKLQSYLVNFLKQDAAPDFYQAGMAATVRAVALNALISAGKIDRAEVERFEPFVKQMSLFGQAQMLQAMAVAGSDKTKIEGVLNIILSKANETSGKFVFSEDLDNGYYRILASVLRDNCGVLQSLMMLSDNEEFKTLLGDKPFKLVRMITQTRGDRDYWENTQENLFCMQALSGYAARYESIKPDMALDIKVADQSIGQGQLKSLTDKPVVISKPFAENDLGQERELLIAKQGEGRYYYAAQLSYSDKDPVKETINAGIEVHREYAMKQDGKWKLLSEGEKIKRGDVVRVDLYVDIPAARNFVVVNDPLAGAFETVNQDLATASAVDGQAGDFEQSGGFFWFKHDGWREYGFSRWSFYHRELRHDSARFYADWLPAGRYHLSYAMQAIADGEFSAPPATAEEMYDPDVYGRSLGHEFSVQTAQ